ncbi:hypothetical protein [Nocardioides coralli]|uniref:hypothetical protein n=1 Tax=Nocardioides coralli TaxID=2872154 RepID=UPI001CA4103B|nr:hypothetical protein [Nocardioides coralli]QZY28962.1 hypothetical protein K6T13_16225 [Nocardioides coralli]
MAQLGEVLGGMLTDVVRARMAADEVTAEAVDAYRADPTLASLSVPRATVSSLTVRLNFAVNSVELASAVPFDLDEVGESWTKRLADRVLEKFPPIRSTGRGTDLRSVPVVRDDLDVGLRGDLEPLVATTMGHLMQGRGRVSAAEREELADLVRDQARLLVEDLRRVRFADVAKRSTIDVEVGAAEVAQSPPETLQSLEVTFAVDDLEEILPDPAQWR